MPPRAPALDPSCSHQGNAAMGARVAASARVAPPPVAHVGRQPLCRRRSGPRPHRRSLPSPAAFSPSAAGQVPAPAGVLSLRQRPSLPPPTTDGPTLSARFPPLSAFSPSITSFPFIGGFTSELGFVSARHRRPHQLLRLF
ncbi:hypothetical protein D1007_11862 [Hordeum vulgare]|uniref:Predicted protein n=1 Tax=Hordeum vulgare subsp. vulgare TaxID=112509 RepID=F2CRU3_HORVV|nr:hypothetical protein D1007_11862 [Hordeum vulgare]BAJ85564.1 predicted protein [Hordeum vulgare subsp. vulgare]